MVFILYFYTIKNNFKGIYHYHKSMRLFIKNHKCSLFSITVFRTQSLSFLFASHMPTDVFGIHILSNQNNSMPDDERVWFSGKSIVKKRSHFFVMLLRLLSAFLQLWYSVRRLHIPSRVMTTPKASALFTTLNSPWPIVKTSSR